MWLWLSGLWKEICQDRRTSGPSRLLYPVLPAQYGIELMSLAIGSLLSKGSLGLAEGEAAGLAFLQWFSNIYLLVDMLPGP